MRRHNVRLSAVLLYLSASIAHGQGSPFKAEIKLTRTEVSNHETFSVATAIRNTSMTDQLLDVWTCSYSEQWVSDNLDVHVEAAACLQNVHYKVKLAPGEAYERAVPIYFAFCARKTFEGPVTFRLGFHEATRTKRYPDNSANWSNQVTLNVTTTTPQAELRSSHYQNVPACTISRVGIGHSSEIGSKYLFPLLRGSQISAQDSGVGFDIKSQRPSEIDIVTIANVSGDIIYGPFHLVLDSLSADVTMSNATGTCGCMPYITFKGVSSLAPGQLATATIKFSNPRWGMINFVPLFYRGNMN
jgi:hypothetical protein